MPDSKGFVLLDASVLEGRYLRPLLQGEVCRDVRVITEHGYTPAVLQKSLAEVWLHAKLGSGNAVRWAGESVHFPGSIDCMVSTIERQAPEINARKTAWLWFNLSEEWRGRTGNLDGVRREFLAWKESIETFCRHIEVALMTEGIKILWPPAHHQNSLERQRAASLERELALHSLLPSEDAGWVLDALIVKARALVTCDAEVAERGRLSLGFNHLAPSTVHPTRLREAVDDDFGLAVSAANKCLQPARAILGARG